MFGSDGSDENSLRAAIGYNHGSLLLFDNQSYRNFLGKFSNILIQDIIITKEHKQINNIYLSKRQAINDTLINTNDIVSQYQKIIADRTYFLSESEKINLNQILNNITSIFISPINIIFF